MLNFFQPDPVEIAIAVALPLAGAALSKGIEKAAAYVKENSRTIKFLRKHYAVIDAVLNQLTPAAQKTLQENPVGHVVSELLKDADFEVSDQQLSSAIVWAGEKFDWNLHELFSERDLSAVDKRLAKQIKSNLIERFGND